MADVQAFHMPISGRGRQTRGGGQADAEAIANALVEWYRVDHRILPWRETQDPYPIWLSEIMLQQTQVATALPYFERFVDRLPSIDALAAAPEEEVIKLWEGLGYYARCRNLHRAARIISRDHDGRFPDDLAVVEGLPGIGPSTAGAILTFAYGQRHPILDGNVTRILTRLNDIDGDVTRSAVKKELWRCSRRLLEQAADAADFNQAAMELGATVCTPRKPRCGECPVAAWCRARKNGTELERPVRRKQKARPHYHIAVGVIWNGDEVLIQQRPADGLLGGLWEFPGGKQEPGEALSETVAREVREELGIVVDVGERFATVDHAYSHFSITLHAFQCRYTSGRPEPRASQRWRWADLSEIGRFAFPKANRRVLEILADRGSPD